MSDLPPGLEDFGTRLERATEREIEEREARRRPRTRWRNLGLPVVAALLAAAVSAGAVKLVESGSGDPIEPESGDADAPFRAPQDSAVVAASAAEDPAGGPPWVVRAFTNAAGRECVQVGRLRAGVFGQVQAGRFRPLPASSPGTCAGDADAAGPLIAIMRTGSERTIVFGLAVDRAPVTVRVGERSQRVDPAGLGAFVAVFVGASPNQRVVVRSSVNGRTHVDRL